MTDTKIDTQEILSMIPHRYPIMLVDRVTEIEEGERIVALKNVTYNESFFQGHFPGKPVMPGVLIIEALAQASAVLVVRTMKEETEDKIVYFMSIDDARFRKPVVPGDSLYLHLSKIKNRGNIWKFSGEAKVEGKKVAEAVITAMIVDKKDA
ncbi:MAG: 3-hydroxyacyl-ACP dehydratase FabZ [Rickettsiales bacterium]|nr:3-hydroxyacyl-ACP dehydratase FabZ [Rickettsiales bacterium]